MDENMSFVREKRLARTIEALENNNYTVRRAKNTEEARALAQSFVSSGMTVGFGGSMTLAETGVLADLRARGDSELFDRAKDPDAMRKALTADVFFASTNAVTETGVLYNVDGNGNRVAAMLFGPQSVVLLVGENKIVPDEAAAVSRVERVASPANTERLNCDTPCRKTGFCVHCRSEQRICRDFVWMRQQRVKGRIKIILIDGEWGY